MPNLTDTRVSLGVRHAHVPGQTGVYTCFFKGCRIKIWMTTMCTLDLTRGPPAWVLCFRGDYAGPASAMPPFMGHETQDAKKMCHLEPETPPPPPPHSGHWNSLTKWELHEQFLGSSSWQQIVPPVCPPQQFAGIGAEWTCGLECL